MYNVHFVHPWILCMAIFLYTINIANKYCKVGKLWIPYIIFRNTDSDEAVTVDGDIRTLVSVTRQGDFVRSGPEVADEGTFCKVI